jgi:cytoskeletal protein CcmA (bactofilin family)
MAIFTNGGQPQKEHTNTTIITEGSHIKGDMRLACALYIDGIFEGTIESTSMVTVGKNGRIRGEIFARKLMVQGIIEGSVDADRIEIMSEGKLLGSIVSSELVIESSGLFEGESKIKSTDSSSTKIKQPISAQIEG